MNKPVAWMSIQEGIFSPSFKYLFSETEKKGFIPLYTHPVKEQELLDEIAQLKHINRNWQISENILLLELEKLQMRELTDEEIEKIANENLGDSFDCDIMWMRMFVKAIIRKAQE